MRDAPANPLVLAVVRCPSTPKAFRWVINDRDGELVGRSPYAFTSAGGALISGRCWMRELAARAP